MFPRWLTLTALLSTSASPRTAANGGDALTVAPTCKVKGQAEADLTLNCGDGKSTGVVEYWHTPFGDLPSPGLGRERDPVFVHRNGSLVLTNLSSLHAGLYHCLLRQPRGSTLFLYDLQVPRHEKDGGRGRLRREVPSEEEKEKEKAGEDGGVSDGLFAGAVAASVILTFVVGFGAGALSRAHVLRCLGSMAKKLKQQSAASDGADGVSMATLPPMSDNRAFQMEGTCDSDTADWDTVESATSTTSFPPAKPKRSFRDKHHEEHQEAAAYLEGCDYPKAEETGGQQGDKGTPEEKLEGGRIEQSGASEVKTGERENVKEEDRGEVNIEDKEGREVTGEHDDGGDRQEEKTEEEEEDVSPRTSEEDDTDSSRPSSSDSEEEETGSKKMEESSKGSEDGDQRPPSRGRRSRVIRLYQYDEEGQRYYHLPNPGPEDPGPAPRLKARSASLTRLGAIMAAASAGPLDTSQGETEEGEKTEEVKEEVKAHFQMDI